MQEINPVVTWYQKPKLRDPIFIAAFEGFNDAGEAATDSVAWLVDNYDSQLIAEIDGDDFFDYQAIRPIATIGNGSTTEISWPRNKLYGIKIPEADRDLVALLSHEPNFKWKTFCAEIETITSTLKCSDVFTLGSLMAEVPHTRPVRLSGLCENKDKLEALEVKLSNYDGPVGIVGILHDHLCKIKESTSLWAAIPHYVSQRPQPAAMTELLNAFGALVNIDFDTSELANEAAEWVSHVNEAVSQDDQALDYVSHLEDMYDNGYPDDDEYELADQELPTADNLADEVEKFLRDQPPEHN